VKWFEVCITTTSEGTEAMSELLFDVGAKGVVIEDKEDLLRFINEGEGFDYADSELTERYDSTVKVKGYLPDTDGTHDVISDIKVRVEWLLNKDLGIDITPGTVSVNEIYEQDWAHSWKEYFKPVKVSELMFIKPSWESYAASPGDIVIDMDPGMAFGTGTHETTILCLRALEKYVRQDSWVLDIGCGTGVLGIAAILLGAKRAVLIDNDPQAIKVAEANSIKNGTYEKTLFINGNLLDRADGKFDILVANISSKVLERMIPECTLFLEHKGFLIVSGILKESIDAIVSVMNDSGISLAESHTLGDWAVVVGQHA